MVAQKSTRRPARVMYKYHSTRGRGGGRVTRNYINARWLLGHGCFLRMRTGVNVDVLSESFRSAASSGYRAASAGWAGTGRL